VREGSEHPAGPDAWRHMPEEHPLMRTALRVLSLDEVVQDVGIGFDVTPSTASLQKFSLPGGTEAIRSCISTKIFWRLSIPRRARGLASTTRPLRSCNTW